MHFATLRVSHGTVCDSVAITWIECYLRGRASSKNILARHTSPVAFAPPILRYNPSALLTDLLVGTSGKVSGSDFPAKEQIVSGHLAGYTLL